MPDSFESVGPQDKMSAVARRLLTRRSLGRVHPAIWPAAAVVGLCLLPFVSASDYWLRIVNNICIIFILTLGLDFIWGRTGQFSLAQAGFFGIGAYASALLAMNLKLPFLAAVGLASTLAAVVAVAVGVSTLRLRTHYFALATFAFSEIARLVATNWQSLTRGMDGLTQIPPASIAGLVIRDDGTYYFLALGFVLAGSAFHRQLLASKFGRAFTAVRQGERVAELVGLNSHRIKVFAFAISALFAGAAGALYAHLFSVVSPDILSLENVTVPVLVALFIGGSGSLAGIALGAVVVVALPEVLRDLRQWYLVFYGIGILLLMVYMPDGLAPSLKRWWGRRVPPTGVDSRELNLLDAPVIASAFQITYARDLAKRALRVHQLTKRFGGITAVDRLDFDVRPGEITSIIGPNGAGKTTVLNLITGVYRSDGGSVRLGSLEILGQPCHRIAAAGISRTFQHTRVWPDLSVVENVMVALHDQIHGSLAEILIAARRPSADERAARQRAEEALAFVGLENIANAPAGTLSFGYLRLLELARCLVAQPRLILLDEPAAGLSHHVSEMLLTRLRTIRSEGVSIVLIEHNLPFVMAVSDTVLVMNKGQGIAEGPPATIRSDPNVVEAYLGA